MLLMTLGWAFSPTLAKTPLLSTHPRPLKFAYWGHSKKDPHTQWIEEIALLQDPKALLMPPTIPYTPTETAFFLTESPRPMIAFDPQIAMLKNLDRDLFEGRPTIDTLAPPGFFAQWRAQPLPSSLEKPPSISTKLTLLRNPAQPDPCASEYNIPTEAHLPKNLWIPVTYWSQVMQGQFVGHPLKANSSAAPEIDQALEQITAEKMEGIIQPITPNGYIRIDYYP
jgi:hypothetical protein